MLFLGDIFDLVKKYNFIENLSEEDLIRPNHKDYFDIKINSRLVNYEF